MTRRLMIVEPVPIVQIVTNVGGGASYLRTADPKEVWQSDQNTPSVFDIDLGAVQEIDAIFLGFSNAAAGALWGVDRTESINGLNRVPLTGTVPFRVEGGEAIRRHGLASLAAPAATRYLRVTVAQAAGAPLLQLGVVLIGKRFEHAYEYKAGRRPIDLSERVDLVGGGFGFGRGAIKSSFRFTFADLDQVAVDRLWRIVTGVGNQHPIVLVEGGDGAIAHDQVHYGVFERFEAYEREDAADTRWGLSMQDWV